MATQPRKAPVKKPENTLVKMVRDGKTADVHPDEVENYRKGGYELKHEE